MTNMLQAMEKNAPMLTEFQQSSIVKQKYQQALLKCVKQLKVTQEICIRKMRMKSIMMSIDYVLSFRLSYVLE